MSHAFICVNMLISLVQFVGYSFCNISSFGQSVFQHWPYLSNALLLSTCASNHEDSLSLRVLLRKHEINLLHCVESAFVLELERLVVSCIYNACWSVRNDGAYHLFRNINLLNLQNQDVAVDLFFGKRSIRPRPIMEDCYSMDEVMGLCCPKPSALTSDHFFKRICRYC